MFELQSCKQSQARNGLDEIRNIGNEDVPVAAAAEASEISNLGEKFFLASFHSANRKQRKCVLEKLQAQMNFFADIEKSKLERDMRQQRVASAIRDSDPNEVAAAANSESSAMSCCVSCRSLSRLSSDSANSERETIDRLRSECSQYATELQTIKTNFDILTTEKRNLELMVKTHVEKLEAANTVIQQLREKLESQSVERSSFTPLSPKSITDQTSDTVSTNRGSNSSVRHCAESIINDSEEEDELIVFDSSEMLDGSGHQSVTGPVQEKPSKIRRRARKKLIQTARSKQRQLRSNSIKKTVIQEKLSSNRCTRAAVVDTSSNGVELLSLSEIRSSLRKLFATGSSKNFQNWYTFSAYAKHSKAAANLRRQILNFGYGRRFYGNVRTAWLKKISRAVEAVDRGQEDVAVIEKMPVIASSPSSPESTDPVVPTSIPVRIIVPKSGNVDNSESTRDDGVDEQTESTGCSALNGSMRFNSTLEQNCASARSTNDSNSSFHSNETDRSAVMSLGPSPRYSSVVKILRPFSQATSSAVRILYPKKTVNCIRFVAPHSKSFGTV